MRQRDEQLIFGNIFLLANQLQTIIDRDFKPFNLTTKQWFLMASIGEFGEDLPTLSQVADKMGNSHQNIKQLALKLKKSGYVEIIQDEKDRRVQRLKLTDKCHEFWKSRVDTDVTFFNKLFGNFDDIEVRDLKEKLMQMNEILKSER
jgi:DNA-binding MarR family transcriptional regulator